MAQTATDEVTDGLSATSSRLLPSIKGLLDSARWSDFVITCGLLKWHVHKAIICSQSTYFLKVVDGDFKEANTKMVSLEEDDERAVHAMVEFFYTGTYTSPAAQATGEHLSPMSHDILVYHLTKKYMLDDTLMKETLVKFQDHTLNGWSSAAFTTALEEAFNSAPVEGDDLTKAVTRVAKTHVVALYTSSTDGCPEFRRAARNIPVLAAELTETLAHRHKELLSFQQKTTTKSNTFVDVKCPTPSCAKLGAITFSLYKNATSIENVFCPFCGTKRSFVDWYKNYRVK